MRIAVEHFTGQFAESEQQSRDDRKARIRHEFFERAPAKKGPPCSNAGLHIHLVDVTLAIDTRHKYRTGYLPFRLRSRNTLLRFGSRRKTRLRFVRVNKREPCF